MPTLSKPNWAAILSSAGSEESGIANNEWSPSSIGDDALACAIELDQEDHRVVSSDSCLSCAMCRYDQGCPGVAVHPMPT